MKLGIVASIACGGACAMALMAADSAFAQAGDGSAAAENTGGVEDIIVTAQRRNERQQDVPISISTVTAASAAKMGIVGTEGLGIAVPSLQFGRQFANGGTPYLRGVGTNSAAAGVESPVAVYIGAASATTMQFNNIESTEVLKGPQGTLFGRNATGGVVHIHTRRPSHVFSLDATAGGGSYGTYFGNLYVTGGLGDTVAVNFAAAGNNRTEGYGRSAYTGEEIYKSRNYGFRSQLLWTPGSGTEILISGDYDRYKGDDGMNPSIAPGTIALGGSGHQGRFRSVSSPIDHATSENWGLSARIQQDLGFASLVSVSAYRESKLASYGDLDGSLPGAPAIISNEAHSFSETFSQELQLVSAKGDAFNWIGGLYYFRSANGYDPLIQRGLAFAPLGGASIINTRQVLHSYAAFGEASYEFLPETKLTVGLRYTTDKFDLDATLRNAAGVVRTPSPFERDSSFSKMTYRAILDHKIAADALVYASYSRGFKSGGYNLSSPTFTVGGVLTPSPPVAPEILDAYELGLKLEVLDRRLRINASAFRYDYSDMQVTSVQDGQSISLNAARARMTGVDLDWNFVPSRRLSLGGGLSFLNSKFKSFPSGPYYVPNPASCARLSSTGPATGGNLTCFADLSGNRTPRAPKFTMSLQGTYTIPTKEGDFSLNASWYHNAGYFWEVDNQYAQPKHDLVNTTLGWTSPDYRLELQIYARNILNKYYYNYFAESTTRAAGQPAMPRNFGGSVSVHF